MYPNRAHAFPSKSDQATPQFQMETTIHSETSSQLSSLFFTNLPLEIRFQIYDQLLNTQHLIIITPNGPQRGIFEPLLPVCKTLRAEIREWLLGKNDGSIVRSPVFGVFNSSLTTFKMSWVYTGYDRRIFASRTLYERSRPDRYQRCYPPSRAAAILSQLENWQKAMDATNSDCSDQIDRWMAYPSQVHAIMNVKWLRVDADDWRVLDERVLNDYIYKECFFEWKEEIGERYVWSDDFESHAMHQGYSRQYPTEKGRVRKVECGLAFEFRFVWTVMSVSLLRCLLLSRYQVSSRECFILQ